MDETNSTSQRTISLLSPKLDKKKDDRRFNMGINPKMLVIAGFADLAVKGGFVPFAALRGYLGQSATILPLLISELRFEGLVEPAYNDEYGDGIRLTAKGAVRLWFWCWPEKQQVVLR